MTQRRPCPCGSRQERPVFEQHGMPQLFAKRKMTSLLGRKLTFPSTLVDFLSPGASSDAFPTCTWQEQGQSHNLASMKRKKQTNCRLTFPVAMRRFRPWRCPAKGTAGENALAAAAPSRMRVDRIVLEGLSLRIFFRF